MNKQEFNIWAGMGFQLNSSSSTLIYFPLSTWFLTLSFFVNHQPFSIIVLPSSWQRLFIFLHLAKTGRIG